MIRRINDKKSNFRQNYRTLLVSFTSTCTVIKPDTRLIVNCESANEHCAGLISCCIERKCRNEGMTYLEDDNQNLDYWNKQRFTHMITYLHARLIITFFDKFQQRDFVNTTNVSAI